MKYPASGVYSVLFAPTASATTVRTANLDCADANYATIIVAVPAELNTNSTNVALQLSESDDTTASNFVTFDSTFNRTIDNTAGAVAVSHVDLEARKRYIRVTATPDSTTNGPVIPIAVASLYKTVRSATSTDYGANVVEG